MDGRAVLARVRKERDRFVAETLKSIEKLPAGICVKQRARFSDATTLALEDGRKVSAKAIVIATGSRPSVPKEFEKLGDIVLTNETIFELRPLPRSIAVVGAGPLGLELAQAMARLGVETIMFDQGDQIAALRDAEVARSLRSVLGKEFPIHLGVKLDVEKDGRRSASFVVRRIVGHGIVRARLGRRRAAADAGRLEPCGDRSRDERARRSEIRPFHAPVRRRADLPGGGRRRSAPSAARSFLGRRDRGAERGIVSESTESQARRAAVDHVHRSSARHDRRASVRCDDRRQRLLCRSRSSQGGSAKRRLVRIYAGPDTGIIAGATLFGPGMDHIAHLFAWAIERRETADTLLQLPFYHPTFEEGLKPALREICEAVKSPDLGDLDDVAPPGA